jgi:hypothetical protein
MCVCAVQICFVSRHVTRQDIASSKCYIHKDLATTETTQLLHIWARSNVRPAVPPPHLHVSGYAAALDMHHALLLLLLLPLPLC